MSQLVNKLAASLLRKHLVDKLLEQLLSATEFGHPAWRTTGQSNKKALTSTSLDNGAIYLIGLVIYFTVETGPSAMRTFSLLASSVFTDESANAIIVPWECPM